MHYDKKTFQEHLEKDHNILFIGEYLKEIVYGGTDGIVTTFAVIAGFSGAYLNVENTLQLSVLSVLLFGLANLFADGTAMGLGNFISLRAEQKRYESHQRKEWHEIQTNPQEEKKETIFLLMQHDFTKEDAENMTTIFMKYPKYWLNFMMKEELEMEDASKINPAINGIATFTSFCIFGFIPIIPYLLLNDPKDSFISSCILAFFALLLLGSLSAWITKHKWLSAITETVVVGTIAASVAYFVGTLFA